MRCRRVAKAICAARVAIALLLFGSSADALAGVPGAANPLLWAYQQPRKGAVPEVKDHSWPRNDIDCFILAKLEAKGISPSVPADPVVLVRRLYFDLIGLPPTPKEIDEFLRDSSPEGIARVVDRLLGSDRFGERWGRHWLDVARYAESMTLRGFVFKEAWRYRDYVIESFNRDYPLDRFLEAQIAGDLLPADSVEEARRNRVATTFLVLGNINLEEQDKKQLDMDVVDEQLDVIGKAFMGQTIGCARCHDHKFDPISANDYYAMAGILRSVQTLEHANVSKWVELPLPVEPEEEEKLQQHEAAVKALEMELKTAREQAKKLGVGVSKNGAAAQPLAVRDLPGFVVDDARASRVGAWVSSQHSKNYVGDGYIHDGNSDKGQKTVTFYAEGVAAGRYEVRLAYTHAANRAARVPVDILHADGESTVYVNQQDSPPFDGRFVSLGQFRFEANGQGYVLVSNEGTTGHVIADAVQFLPIDKTNSVAAQTQPAAEPDQTATQEKRKAEEAVKQLEEKLKQLAANGPARDKYMSVRETSAGDIRLHKRGSVHNLGEPVPRGFLTAAQQSPAAIPASQSGRRELAEWVASPSNPLTARVIVNRVWHWLFGAGLVRTPDNFGTTGDLPSHPELLDYLAIRFRDEGWSVKKLIRAIVLSRTYQQSSVDSSNLKAAEIDAENRLLWRFNRRRVDAESLRDSMLFASGQLELISGGPTIKPGTSADYGYQYSENSRSVYAPVLRNALLDFFDTFDFANPSMVTGRRDSSTVASQALYLLNHPFVIDKARHAASRFLALPDLDDAARVNEAYRIVLGRLPSAREKEITLKHLLAADSATAPDRVERWSQFAQGLFASIDFRYVD